MFNEDSVTYVLFGADVGGICHAFMCSQLFYL